MKQAVESLINGVTMYRLVLYGLYLIVVTSFALSLTGQLTLPALNMFVTLIILLGVSYASSRLFAWTFSTTHNKESWHITALILFLIIPPVTDIQGYVSVTIIALIATASKYLLAWRGRHLFNPAAIAVLLSGAAGLLYASWWVATPLLLPVVTIVGLLVTWKLRHWAMVGTYVLVGLATLSVVAVVRGDIVADAVLLGISSWPLLFAGTIMLTEPLTAPTTRRWQLWYAVVAGVLTTWQLSWLFTPELALVVGNVLAFAAGQRKGITLRLAEVKEIAPRTLELLFTSKHPLRYEPGQYLEFTAPHTHVDSRGIRRTFSIASAPHETYIRFGMTTGEPSSTFKHHLRTMQAGDVVRATHVGGDFTLPRDDGPLLLIAGGIGATPFRAMLSNLLHEGKQRDIVLLYGAKDESAVVYADILDAAEKHAGVTVVPVLSNPSSDWQGEAGFVTADIIMLYAPDVTSRTVMLSGPPLMVDAVRRQLHTLKVPRRQIKTDYFSGY